MGAISKAGALGLLIMASTALAVTGCGTTPSPRASGSATPSSPAPTQTASPSPSTSAPGFTIYSYRTSYPWHWPGDQGRPADVRHSYPVPPLPELIAINVGDHPAFGSERHYNRMSFTFTTAFPSYQASYTDSLTSDPADKPVTLAGDGVLKIVFRQAQAHTDQGNSSIQSEPPAHLGLTRMTSWAHAGDFEGVVTFGIGISWPGHQSNQHLPIRITELEKISTLGAHTHLYVVAIDVDATGGPGSVG